MSCVRDKTHVCTIKKDSPPDLKIDLLLLLTSKTTLTVHISVQAKFNGVF